MGVYGEEKWRPWREKHGWWRRKKKKDRVEPSPPTTYI
jgi:hypothetical protein